MKIKIIEPGYENFTGMFGVVAFHEGVSVDHVAHANVNLLASIVKVVDAESGAETGNLATEAAAWDKTADTIYYPTLADIEAGRSIPQTVSPVQEAQVPKTVYTQEELEAIADKSGITGLREIADPMNVKSTSIAKLIEGILNAQSGVAQVADAPADAPAAPAEAPAPVDAATLAADVAALAADVAALSHAPAQA